MKKAYALQISEKNFEGLLTYGYATNIPKHLALSGYLILGSGGPYVCGSSAYFEETFEFTEDGATIELTNLVDFGADKDERTLRPFKPKNSDIMYWDSFVIRLFYDKKHDFSGSLEAGVAISIPD